MSNSFGEPYDYAKNIRSPSEIGMSDKGTIPQLGRNVNGFMAYQELLVSGKSKASVTNQPLGNKFFVNTGAQCNAKDTCTKDDSGIETCSETNRYIYINNVPSGRIPFLSGSSGVNFSGFRGLTCSWNIIKFESFRVFLFLN
jgi:hypothetical protein